MKNYICTHCKTDYLTFNFDTQVVWDKNKQEFICKPEPHDFVSTKAFCAVCETWMYAEMVEE